MKKNSKTFKTLYRLTQEEKRTFMKDYYQIDQFAFGIELIYGCVPDDHNGNDRVVLNLASGKELSPKKPVMIDLLLGELDMSENPVATLVIKNDEKSIPVRLNITNHEQMGSVEKVGIEMTEDGLVRLVFQSGDKIIYSEKCDKFLCSFEKNGKKTAGDGYQVGNKITFGQYEGKPLSWWILDRKGNQVLLLNEEGVTEKSYHNKNEEVTWESCSLREWLNQDFYQNSFSDEEKQRIEVTEVLPHENPGFPSDPGKATRDRVFLLSIEETEDYFTDTGFKNLDKQLLLMTSVKNSRAWWLRTPGHLNNYAAAVWSKVSLFYEGYSVSDEIVVRPAVWINLSS